MKEGHISRRRLLTAAGAGITIASLFGPGVVLAAVGNTVSLQLNWIPSVDFAGFYIADALGYYKQEGIGVKFLPGGPNMQGVEQVVAGGAGTAGLPTFLTSTINAVQHQAKLTVIGSVFQTSPLALISLQSLPLNSAKDLVGKRIGAAQGRQRELDAVFKINGLPANGYTFVPIGYDSTPLTKGSVDIISVFATSEPVTLAEQGVKTNMILFAAMGLPTYTSPIVVSSDAIAKNRKVILGFLRGSIKGWEMNAKDPTLAPKLVAERYAGSMKIDQPHQLRVNQAMVPLTQSDLTRDKGMLWIDKTKISGPIYAALRAAGETQLPAVDSYVDTSLLEEVFGNRTQLL
ncbi:ABC transporter substrate-binding protein [Sodalis ligni]|uniref:ABC transporter substrate-binding protein n=1 Tax=Sodalis ligni TaxID=2697027 RepID=UPI00193FE786|nr:ABC transporter substrate-binding protein [Sodalis ligni]QWA11455.1 ABC transporter substrate-binding protein [Sodalis ligni]